MSQILSDMIEVLASEGRSILECAERWQKPENQKNLEKIVLTLQATLEGGGKIIITGVGKSGKIAQKIAATFASTGSLALYLHPTEGLHGDLGMISASDAIIALSANGNSEEILRLIPALRTRKVTLIAITGNPQSQLAQKSDLVLDASVTKEACPLNLAPTTSSTLALAIGDAVAIALMKLRGFKIEDFALNHPGGALGKRLSLHVSDLMIPFEKTARVEKNTSIEEVINESTRAKHGAVLVIEAGKLLGIVTDGDLRRALSKKDQFFSLKAHEVMTANPISVNSSAWAVDALRTMENRTSQISVLPVINEAGIPVGLVRLHDLVGQL